MVRGRGLASVALPDGIGCGLAGGTWTDYEKELEAFAVQHPGIRVVLYSLPQGKDVGAD